MSHPGFEGPEPLRAKSIRTALLDPASVALVGASDDPSKTSARPLQYLRRAGYAGKIFPVNPRSATVLGEKAWPSLSSLPEVPEHVFVLTTTHAACQAVEECAALGVKAVTVLAGGFGESGPEGAERAQNLAAIARKAGMLLLGPSSLGLVNARSRLTLTANAAFAEADMPAGRTFVASHSGSMLGALVSRGKARGIGFAGMVSVGNEADLSIGEICLATVDDPGIDAYLLFLESIRHGDWLRRFAREAARRGKPVAVYKLGRSEAGAELAQSHTGALAGEDAAADTFLRECSFARVDNFEAVFEIGALLRQMPRAPAHPGMPRVGVVTTTGGGAAMIVDQLGVRGVEVRQPGQETFDRLASMGIEVQPGRILDLTLAGTRYEVMRGAIESLLEAPEIDAVVAVAGSSARFQPELAVRPIIDCHRATGGTGKPLLAFLAPEAPEALKQLAEAGVPCFRTPEACAEAMVAAWRRGPYRETKRVPVVSQQRAMLDELAAYGVVSALGIRHAPAQAVPLNADSDVRDFGGQGAVRDGADGAPDISIAYPVAAKVLSSTIAHKSDVGGVVLGIRDRAGLSDALREIACAVRERAPGAPVDSALVQSMVSGVGEVLIGYRVDPDAGPLVMLSAGGVLAEIYRDRSLRLAPVDLAGAREMIVEVRAMAALSGFRGRPAGDLEALAHAIVALSRIAERPELNVLEAEVNPLIVHRAGEGVTAVDALVWIAGSQGEQSAPAPA